MNPDNPIVFHMQELQSPVQKNVAKDTQANKIEGIHLVFQNHPFIHNGDWRYHVYVYDSNWWGKKNEQLLDSRLDLLNNHGVDGDTEAKDLKVPQAEGTEEVTYDKITIINPDDVLNSKEVPNPHAEITVKITYYKAGTAVKALNGETVQSVDRPDPIVTAGQDATFHLNIAINDSFPPSTLSVQEDLPHEMTYVSSSPPATLIATTGKDTGNYLYSLNWTFSGSSVQSMVLSYTLHAPTSSGPIEFGGVVNVDGVVLVIPGMQLAAVSSAPPFADIWVFSSPPLATKLITFSGIGTDPELADPFNSTMVSYSWNFGDGNSTTLGSSFITHRYMSFGVYTVQLTVTTNNGKTGNTTLILPIPFSIGGPGTASRSFRV